MTEPGIITIAVEIVLSGMPVTDDQVSERLAAFIDQVRDLGVTVTVRPTPEEVARELDEWRGRVAALPAGQLRTEFEDQVARIESLNRFRQAADRLLTDT